MVLVLLASGAPVSHARGAGLSPFESPSVPGARPPVLGLGAEGTIISEARWAFGLAHGAVGVVAGLALLEAGEAEDVVAGWAGGRRGQTSEAGLLDARERVVLLLLAIVASHQVNDFFNLIDSAFDAECLGASGQEANCCERFEHLCLCWKLFVFKF